MSISEVGTDLDVAERDRIHAHGDRILPRLQPLIDTRSANELADEHLPARRGRRDTGRRRIARLSRGAGRRRRNGRRGAGRRRRNRRGRRGRRCGRTVVVAVLAVAVLAIAVLVIAVLVIAVLVIAMLVIAMLVIAMLAILTAAATTATAVVSALLSRGGFRPLSQNRYLNTADESQRADACSNDSEPPDSSHAGQCNGGITLKMSGLRQALSARPRPVHGRRRRRDRSALATSRASRTRVGTAAASATLVPVTVIRLDHVQLAMPAGREPEAIAFYRDVLGIPHVPKPAHLAARGGCWFERGDLKIHLGVEADFRPARKAHPAFIVDDVRGIARRRHRRRVRGERRRAARWFRPGVRVRPVRQPHRVDAARGRTRRRSMTFGR